jgi:hypothetical protein
MAATTAMIIGAAAAGAQAIGSIAQAQKQKKLQQEAEVETAKALAKAEDLIVTEFQEGVQLPLEAYELEAQTNIANQRQLVESLGGAGQRAVIGGVGRVGATGAMASESARLRMQKEQYLRDNAIAAERTGIRNKLVGLEEGKIAGAQQASADAEYRRMMAQQQAMQAIGKGVQYGFGAADLYTGMRDKSPSSGGYSQITAGEYTGSLTDGRPTPTITNTNSQGTEVDLETTNNYEDLFTLGNYSDEIIYPTITD